MSKKGAIKAALGTLAGLAVVIQFLPVERTNPPVTREVLWDSEVTRDLAWDQPNEDPDEIIEMVEDGEMPLRKYTLLHPQARLSDEMRAALVRGLRATLAADPPVDEVDDEGGHL